MTLLTLNPSLCVAYVMMMMMMMMMLLVDVEIDAKKILLLIQSNPKPNIKMTQALAYEKVVGLSH